MRMQATTTIYRFNSTRRRWPDALLWLAALAWVAGSACKKGFSSDQFVDDKIVVLAEISALDSIKVPIGKTIKAGGGNIIRFEKVNDATVVLTEEKTISTILQPNFSALYASNPTSVFTTKKRFKSNTHYTILINHPTLGVVSATTLIPVYPKLTGVDTSADIYQGKNLLAADITWQDPIASAEFYVIEALKELVKVNHYFIYRGVRYDYDTPPGKALFAQVSSTPGVRVLMDTVSLNKFVRLGVYTQDNNTENAHIDLLTNSFRRIFLTDNSFNGQSYTTRVWIDPQFFRATEPSQKGRVHLQLKSASKELFDYLILYEKYKTDFGSVPANQLTSPDGNIQHGIGIFGGSAKREKIYYFDELK
ncbi:MAG TPA: DUF4249 family protein [Chitinophagaceae bacterium]|nr:DUF4249 family protein [Chitinophagaceae bacterium]